MRGPACPPVVGRRSSSLALASGQPKNVAPEAHQSAASRC